MRICLLGEFSGNLDEGMRKSSYYISYELSRLNATVLTLDIRKINTPDFWKQIRSFKPDVVHYLHGPTLTSFVLLSIIKVYCGGTKTVSSCMRPKFSNIKRRLIPLFKPDLILTQSVKSEDLFKKYRCKTQFLPIGIDTDKFIPCDLTSKFALRKKYGINEDSFVILHIGSIKYGRNVQIFKTLQKYDNQILLVGALSPGFNEELKKDLENCGCIIWLNYFDNVHEIYELADCYVYPVSYKMDMFGTDSADSIEFPLSVLESMSCNLPVVTTRFGALPRVFNDGDGFYFVESESDFISAVEKIKQETGIIKTREKVLNYSWANIAKELMTIYNGI